jgi:hypothetical protein
MEYCKKVEADGACLERGRRGRNCWKDEAIRFERIRKDARGCRRMREDARVDGSKISG